MGVQNALNDVVSNVWECSAIQLNERGFQNASNDVARNVSEALTHAADAAGLRVAAAVAAEAGAYTRPLFSST